MARRARTAEDGQAAGSPQREELPAEGLHEMPQPVLTAEAGGSSGAPGQARTRLEPKAVAEAREPGAAPRKYRVTNQRPMRVVYGGVVAMLLPGKVVDELNYAIDHLRRQGVTLEELVA